MGSLIGGVIGGIGSLIGGGMQQSANQQAAQQALTGYNFLTSGEGRGPTGDMIAAGAGANNAMAQLLGIAPITAETTNAFNQYKDSTGYNFQLESGQNALTSSASAKGLLNSGATAKGLTEYGQKLGSTTFNNYLAQLAGLTGTGQNALGMVANAGTAGGAGAANYTQAGGAAAASGIGGAFSGIGSGIASLF